MMVALFLAWHDQYFIMFKDLKVFEFTNFPFKTKDNNTVVYLLIVIICSRGENKKKIVETILWLNLLSSY